MCEGGWSRGKKAVNEVKPMSPIVFQVLSLASSLPLAVIVVGVGPRDLSPLASAFESSWDVVRVVRVSRAVDSNNLEITCCCSRRDDVVSSLVPCIRTRERWSLVLCSGRLSLGSLRGSWTTRGRRKNCFPQPLLPGARVTAGDANALGNSRRIPKDTSSHEPVFPL